jgi:hypothetical protein
MENFTKLLKKDNNFRIQHRRLLLIYPSIIDDKENFLQHLGTVLKGKGKKALPKIIIDYNIAGGQWRSNNNKDTTFCLIELDSVFRSNDPNVFDYKKEKPIIRYITHKKHFLQCSDYIVREINGVPDTTIDYIDTVIDLPQFDKYNPWQDELLLFIDKSLKEREHRKIYWLYDPIGNTGKSKFAKHLLLNRPQEVYVIARAVGSRDASTIIKEEYEKGWNGNILIFDLPRNAKERESIYETMECIRNGMMTATKYVGGTVVFENKVMVVFANFLPDVTKMSLDRWIIKKIRKDTLTTVNSSKIYINTDPITKKEIGKVEFPDDTPTNNINPTITPNNLSQSVKTTWKPITDKESNLPLQSDFTLLLKNDTIDEESSDFNLPLYDISSQVSNDDNGNFIDENVDEDDDDEFF